MTNLDQKVVDLLKHKFTLDLLDIYQKRIGFSKLQYTIIKHYYILQDKIYEDIADEYGL